MKVRTSIKAGPTRSGGSDNHNQTRVKIKTKIKAGSTRSGGSGSNGG
jgi:hypothetical protein